MSDLEEGVTTLNILSTEAEHADAVVDAVRKGRETILSTRDGYRRNRIYRATEGDAVLNMTDWDSLDAVKANHEANEQDPEYKRQVAAVDEIAESAPNVYRRVDGPEMSRDAAIDAESKLIAAILGKDEDGLSACLARDFTAIGHAGNIASREKYMAIHLAEDANFTEFVCKDQKLRAIEDSVLVTGWTSMTNASLDADVPPKHYGAVWVREGGAWRCSFWQETPIDDDGAAEIPNA